MVYGWILRVFLRAPVFGFYATEGVCWRKPVRFMKGLKLTLMVHPLIGDLRDGPFPLIEGLSSLNFFKTSVDDAFSMFLMTLVKLREMLRVPLAAKPLVLLE